MSITPIIKQEEGVCPLCEENLSELEGIPSCEMPKMVEGFWIGYSWKCRCGASGIAFEKAEFSHHGIVSLPGQTKEIINKWGEEIK